MCNQNVNINQSDKLNNAVKYMYNQSIDINTPVQG